MYTFNHIEMKRLINILFIFFITIGIYAQKADSIYQNIGNRGFNIESQKIDVFYELPERIQELSSSFITNRFGDYSSGIKFINAQIFLIDSIYKSDIRDLKERNTMVEPIPYYDLNFSFRDSSLGISQYWINIGMDRLGQVIYCNFPYLGSSRMKINSIQKVKEYSDSIMIKMYPEINRAEYKIDLNYNIDNDILIWQFCYLKSAEGNKKDYHCLLINAHSNVLIEEIGMMEMHISPGDDGCCDNSIKLKLNE